MNWRPDKRRLLPFALLALASPLVALVARRSRKASFHALVQQVTDVIAIRDADGALVYLSPAVESLLGFRPQELVGLHPGALESLFHPDDAARAARDFGAALARPGRQPASAYRLRHRDSTWRHVEATHFNMLDDHRVRGVVTSMRDVTAHARAEEALRESEERWRLLVEASPETVAVVQEGRIAYLNAAGARVLGATTASEVLGRPLLDFIHPDFHGAVVERARQLDAGGPQTPLARQIGVGLDGRLIVFETTAVPITANGRPAILAVFRDVGAREAAEVALRESEAQFRALYDADVVPIFFWRADGRINGANDAYLRLAGFTRVELAAGELRWDELTAPEYRELDQQALTEAAARGAWTPYEKEYQLRDGRRVPVVCGGTLLPGRDDRGVAYVVDLSERKRDEEALHLLSARLLQIQDEERRRLARDLHDATGQNLSAVGMNLGHAQQLLGDADPTVRALLVESIALLEQALNEIRTFSYLLHPPLLDEVGLASALEWFADGFSRRSGIAVSLATEGEVERLPAEVETALFRIVQESLTNIHRHAGSASASITVIYARNSITLRVEDQGRGMLGQRAGAAPPGVGIPGMRERVWQLRGRLAIASSADGTTVTAVIPLGDRPLAK